MSDLSAEIGGAILPHVTAFVGVLRSGVTFVREFAANNSALIQSVAAIALVVGGAGSVLVAAGLGFKVLAVAAGGLASAVGAVGAIFGTILSPIGLVTAAIAGVAAWFVTSTEMGQQLVDKLGGGFEKLLGIGKRTFDGIATALAAGNIEAAAGVLWAGLKLMWAEGTAKLRDG